MASNSYSFQDVTCSISGPGGFSFAITGVADEGITFAFADDKSTLTVGADGTPMHSLHASRAGSVSIRLLKVSPINQLLDKMYAYQSGSAANWGQNTITLRNPVSGDAWLATSCAFRKHPDGAYSKDGNMNEWTFNAGFLDSTLGNGSPSL